MQNKKLTICIKNTNSELFQPKRPFGLFLINIRQEQWGV